MKLFLDLEFCLLTTSVMVRLRHSVFEAATEGNCHELGLCREPKGSLHLS